MGADDDLRINTLHRYAKHSPRLTLREYSHCEVPAGCGGVVLRWTDPDDGLAVFVRVKTPNADVDTWLDGTELVSSARALADGPHVLAFHVKRHGTDAGRLFVTPWLGVDNRSPNLLAHDAATRITAIAPPPSFVEPAFDDAAWPTAERVAPRDLVGLRDWARRSIELDLDQGEPVVVSDDEVWVRLHFTLAREVTR